MVFVVAFRPDQDYWIGLWIDNGCNQCNSDPKVTTDCNSCRRQWTWLDNTNMIDELIDKWFHNEPTGDSNCGRRWRKLIHVVGLDPVH